MARPIDPKDLEAVLKDAGFTEEQRNAARAANKANPAADATTEGKTTEGVPCRGHGAPGERRTSMRSF